MALVWTLAGLVDPGQEGGHGGRPRGRAAQHGRLQRGGQGQGRGAEVPHMRGPEVAAVGRGASEP